MKNCQKIALGFTIICCMLIQTLVITDVALGQGPPPRPAPGSSTTGGGQGSEKHGNQSQEEKEVILGDIIGTVRDLSTGLPGAGLTVLINDIPIKTDTSGHFSLTGIAAGTYVVDLNLPADFTAAQPSQTVVVANSNKIDLALGYYSLEPPQVVELPQLEEPPPALPQSGGVSPWLYLGRGDVIGIIIVLTGMISWVLIKET
jgi:hypothetical protein